MNIIGSTNFKSAGFTLLELMIVVAVMGVLVALAQQNYIIYQRKTLQSEAKLNLSGAYIAERSFYSEYSSYIPAFDAIGFTPEGNKLFYTLTACSGAGPWVGSVTGYTGSSATYMIARTMASRWPATSSDPANTCASMSTPTCAATGNDPQTITIGAGAMLCEVCYLDVWRIDQTKRLINCSTGLH